MWWLYDKITNLKLIKGLKMLFKEIKQDLSLYSDEKISWGRKVMIGWVVLAVIGGAINKNTHYNRQTQPIQSSPTQMKDLNLEYTRE